MFCDSFLKQSMSKSGRNLLDYCVNCLSIVCVVFFSASKLSIHLLLFILEHRFLLFSFILAKRENQSNNSMSSDERWEITIDMADTSNFIEFSRQRRVPRANGKCSSDSTIDPGLLVLKRSETKES
jgi:hypothetical protein